MIVFLSKKALKADAWGKYFTQVYGEIPKKGYPLNPENLWMLYGNVLISSQVTDIPALVGDCPTANPPLGQRYNLNNAYAPRFTSWIWHPYPYPALAANSWQEVLHQADPFNDEHFGAWFVYAPGSGVYFNTGTTKAFDEHNDAYKYFKITAGDFNEEMCKAAAKQGYDSVQFLKHIDHANYQCDTKNTGHAGLRYMGVEIVGVKLVGLYACTTSSGAPSSIKAGWQGSRACVCDNSEKVLNCKGVPELQKNSLAQNTSLLV